MVTGISIDPRYKKTAKDKSRPFKTVLEVKEEIRRWIGVPLGLETNVTLTHKHMGRLARNIKTFRKKHFPRVDRGLSALFNGQSVNGTAEYDKWWHALGCFGNARVCQSIMGMLTCADFGASLVSRCL